jgi:phosphatidylglycerophosphate synthase
MMYKNRQKFSFVERTGRIFGFLPANAWTMLGFILMLLSAYLLVERSFLYAAAVFAVAAFIDSVDGAVARHRKEASRFGAYLDTVVDRYTEGIIAVALLLVALPYFLLPHYFWVGLYLFGSMMTTYVKAAAKEKLNKEVKGGLLERPERLLILFAGILAAIFSPLYLTYVIVFLAVVTNLTALQRIRIAVAKKV